MGVAEWGEAGHVLGSRLVSLGPEPLERCVHVDGVPQHHDVDDEAKGAELVLLPLAVALPELAAPAVEDGSGEPMASLVAVELDQDAAAVGLVVDVARAG